MIGAAANAAVTATDGSQRLWHGGALWGCSQSGFHCGHQGRVTAAQFERVLTCVGCNRSERPTGRLALPARKPSPPKPAQPPRGKRQLQLQLQPH